MIKEFRNILGKFYLTINDWYYFFFFTTLFIIHKLKPDMPTCRNTWEWKSSFKGQTFLFCYFPALKLWADQWGQSTFLFFLGSMVWWMERVHGKLLVTSCSELMAWPTVMHAFDNLPNTPMQESLWQRLIHPEL